MRAGSHDPFALHRKKKKKKRCDDLVGRGRRRWLSRASSIPSDACLQGNLLLASSSSSAAHMIATAKLTKEAFFWGSLCIKLKDVVAVSCHVPSRRLTIHSFGSFVTRWVPSLFGVAHRKQKDLHFMASDIQSLLQWANTFAKEGCFVNGLGKGNGDQIIPSDSNMLLVTRRHRAILVILNPHAGLGRACSIFYNVVQLIFKLSGFKMEVIETAAPCHAEKLVTTLNLTDYPDGIICVGGDGIVNEVEVCARMRRRYISVSKVVAAMRRCCIGVSKVLNGLYSREDSYLAMKIPVGVIPAGSDNSLAWTVFGTRDPICAAVNIVKGETISMDVLAAKWTKSSATRLGHTIVYYGFMSDVLEHSAKYQKQFGPLRYFIAGVLRFLYLPTFEIELHYLPVRRNAQRVNFIHGSEEALCTTYDSCNTLEHDNGAINACSQTTKSTDHLPTSLVVRKGCFLGLMICNHQCRSVRCLDYQMLASLAKHDDGNLDLIIVHSINHLQFLLFLFLMQFNHHLSLPFVEYIKVREVILLPGDKHQRCGIDGELLMLDGPLHVFLNDNKFHLSGRKGSS